MNYINAYGEKPQESWDKVIWSVEMKIKLFERKTATLRVAKRPLRVQQQEYHSYRKVWWRFDYGMGVFLF